MRRYRLKWTDDKFEDYANEDEWIEGSHNNLGPNCEIPVGTGLVGTSLVGTELLQTGYVIS